MILFWAIIIGSLYGISFFLFLRRNIFKILIGVMMSSYATNLLIFFSSAPVINGVTIIKQHQHALIDKHSDPLPQALILTAIVIGFGVAAFCIVLFNRLYELTNKDDVDAIKEIE
jgi:multicomponent Na+:H+ antiporter subunit C